MLQLQEHSSTIEKQIEELKAELQQCLNQTYTKTQQLHDDIAELQQGMNDSMVKSWNIHCSKIWVYSFKLPYEIIFPSFKENKDELISDTVYTRLEGYKFNPILAIDEVQYNNNTSYLSVRVNSLRSEYDHKLKFQSSSPLP